MRLPDYGLVNASNGPNGNDKEAVFKPQNKLVLYTKGLTQCRKISHCRSYDD